MSLITDSDEYCPIANQDGVYVDALPSFHNRPQGFRCPCSNKSYTTRTLLSSHIKTIIHKNWIESLNTNRTNYFAELEKERQVVKEQKLIIARMERDIIKLQNEKRKFMETIHFLSNVTSSVREREDIADAAAELDLLDFL